MKKRKPLVVAVVALCILGCAVPVSAASYRSPFEGWMKSWSGWESLFNLGWPNYIETDSVTEVESIELSLVSNVISSNSRTMKVSWTESECDYYEVEFATSPDFSNATTHETKNTEYMFFTFNPTGYSWAAHQTYYIRVRGVTGETAGEWSNTVVAYGK